jgi:hypothetical protein
MKKNNNNNKFLMQNSIFSKKYQNFVDDNSKIANNSANFIV